MKSPSPNQKKLLLIAALVLLASYTIATQIINDQLIVSNTGTDSLLVENSSLGITKHFFSVDTNPGGNVYVTSLEPIGAPNATIGTPTNKFDAIYGQTVAVQADRAYSCDYMCNILDGMQNSTYDWTCTDAFRTTGTITTCTDLYYPRNCLCKN